MNPVKQLSIKSFFLLIILLLIILTSGTILAANSSDLDQITEELNTELNNILNKIAELEIWANTYINLEIINNNINAVLTLDNETVLPEQEIEFYLNESLIFTTTTDSEGSALFPNLNETSPGNYLLKAMFQGNPFLYLNQSSAEKEIEIIDQNGSIKIKFMNETDRNVTVPELLNETLLTIYTDKKSYVQNQTINIFGELIVNGVKTDAAGVLEIVFNESNILTSGINVAGGDYSYSLPANFEKSGNYSVKSAVGELSAETIFYLNINDSTNFEGTNCKEFEERILWSSGYKNLPEGSISYQTWHPQHNCAELNVSDCFLGNVEIQTRFMYFGESNESGEGHIQISNSDESICGNPEQGIYLRDLASETLYGESESRGEYCGADKSSDKKCGITIMGEIGVEPLASCYGIKAYASKNFLVDAFKIKYALCKELNFGGNR